MSDIAATPRATRAGRSVAVRLIAAAGATSLLMWYLIAFPVLTGRRADQHLAHHGYVVLHAVGGTLMLFAGTLALYIGWTRRFFEAHRIVGITYLIGGGLGAGMGLLLSVLAPHPLPGVGLATGTLALTWLAVGALAWRAARSRRFESHRAWMVRSYVLTWTFVLCRMVMQWPGFASASGATIVAVIWISWLLPFAVCEVALQWVRRGRLPSGTVRAL